MAGKRPGATRLIWRGLQRPGVRLWNPKLSKSSSRSDTSGVIMQEAAGCWWHRREVSTEMRNGAELEEVWGSCVAEVRFKRCWCPPGEYCVSFVPANGSSANSVRSVYALRRFRGFRRLLFVLEAASSRSGTSPYFGRESVLSLCAAPPQHVSAVCMFRSCQTLSEKSLSICE